MEMADGSLGEHGIRHESLLLFLSPPQSRVMFRAKGEGHGWSLLFLHHKASLYIEDIMVVVFAYSSNFPPFCIQNFFKRQRGGRGGRGDGKRDVTVKVHNRRKRETFIFSRHLPAPLPPVINPVC